MTNDCPIPTLPDGPIRSGFDVPLGVTVTKLADRWTATTQCLFMARQAVPGETTEHARRRADRAVRGGAAAGSELIEVVPELPVADVLGIAGLVTRPVLLRQGGPGDDPVIVAVRQVLFVGSPDLDAQLVAD